MCFLVSRVFNAEQNGLGVCKIRKTHNYLNLARRYLILDNKIAAEGSFPSFSLRSLAKMIMLSGSIDRMKIDQPAIVGHWETGIGHWYFLMSNL